MTQTQERSNTISSREVQVQLLLDLEAKALIDQLVLALEASSVGEVIRRAVQAYEFFEPVNDDNVIAFKRANATGEVEKKDLHVRMSARTKERLDKAKRASGGTYAEVITRSLQVMAQLVRNRDAARSEHHTARSVIDRDGHARSEDHHCMNELLAVL